MKVRVLEGKKGFDGFGLYSEGDVFEWPDDKPLGSWVEEVNSSTPVVKTQRKPTRAETLPEPAKSDFGKMDKKPPIPPKAKHKANDPI